MYYKIQELVRFTTFLDVFCDIESMLLDRESATFYLVMPPCTHSRIGGVKEESESSVMPA